MKRNWPIGLALILVLTACGSSAASPGCQLGGGAYGGHAGSDDPGDGGEELSLVVPVKAEAKSLNPNWQNDSGGFGGHGLVAVRRPSPQGEPIGGRRRDRTVDACRRTVVPADHLVDQPGVVGMDLIHQIGAGDVLHRPVAPPHLMRKIGPAHATRSPPENHSRHDQLAPSPAWPLPQLQASSPNVASAFTRSGRVAVTRCARPCMSCTSAAVTSSRFVMVRHCVRTRRLSNRFPAADRGRRSATREAIVGGGADGRPGGHAPSRRPTPADGSPRGTRRPPPRRPPLPLP